MNEKFYSTKEFAKLIGKNVRTLERWRQSGKLIPAKIDDNGYCYYSDKQVPTFLKSAIIDNPKMSEVCTNTEQSSDIRDINDFKMSEDCTQSEQSSDIFNQNLAEYDSSVQSRTHKKYKTKKLAEANIDSDTKALIVSNYPDNIATPTYKPYQYATSLFQEGNAYLQAGIDTSNLKVKDGKLFFEDPSGILKELTEVELKNCRNWEPITEITGLPFLRAYYSILLGTYQEALRQGKPLLENIKIYVPDLLEYLGLQRNANRQTIDKIVNQMVSFNNVIGVMNYIRNGKPRQSYYAIFLFGKYEEQSNTITVWSPYLIKVIETIIDEAIKVDSKTKLPKLDKNGKTIPLATNSFLIKSSIYGERNQAAVENVIIIIQVIEQAGNFTPNIKASTIIERNPIFKYRLDESSSRHKTQLLERVFRRTWELLRDETHLTEVYKNIQLPDPDDPKNIPTAKTLNMVFTFPHEGKQGS